MNNKQTQEELQEVKAELIDALANLHKYVKNLKQEELLEINEEFNEILEVINRLQTGKVYISLFGKTSVGKSAIINSLLGKEIAKVGIQKDLTNIVTHYDLEGWRFADMPGIMGKKNFEEIALSEAKKSHGVIFVIDSEPFGDEAELFDIVHNYLPNIPKIVFVNKWDIAEITLTDIEIDSLHQLIENKMSKYVKSKIDIVYGSAHIKKGNERISQPLPQLLERLYEDAGTLGLVMGLIAPSTKASELTEKIKDKINTIRVRVARKVISAFGAATVAATPIPFDSLLIAPGIYATMIFTLYKIMGVKSINKESAIAITKNFFKTCGIHLAVDFTATLTIDMVVNVAQIFLGPFAPLLLAGEAVGLTYFKYKRTVILGEVGLQYICNGGEWDSDGPKATILRCKEKATKYYLKFQKS